ncbi:hypothetical protein J6590_014109, partial [Homalodisca vitripennis]
CPRSHYLLGTKEMILYNGTRRERSARRLHWLTLTLGAARGVLMGVYDNLWRVVANGGILW